MKLVFWQNIVSPHQAPFMRGLAEAGHEVLVVTTEAMSDERELLGWKAPSLGQARIIVGPDKSQVLRIVAESAPDSIQLIAGARCMPIGRQVALACCASGRRMGLITEAPDMRGLGGLLRWVKYSWERITLGRHFDFILAMGQMGVRWFKRCGYPEERIFPFTYVTDRFSGTLCEKPGGVFSFLFVGRLVALKGLDLLLRALVNIPRAELKVVGDGPEKVRLQKLARRLEISDRVFWLGQMESAQVQVQISGADVLVLPSRKDGWGAVINEALMAGTPVICSSACGASELIQYPWLGTVFKKNSTSSLAEAMLHWSALGKTSLEHRQRVRSWSRCIEAPCVAKYMEEILTHIYDSGPRPQVPWRG